MSSGSVSSLTNVEVNGHSGEEPAISTPLRTQTSPAATLYPDPNRGALLSMQMQPHFSPAAPRTNKIKAGMRKVFTRGPNQISDDTLYDGGVNAGRQRRMPSLNILRSNHQQPRYRLRIPGRRRRSRHIASRVDPSIDSHVFEEDGINSDPEGMVDDFVEISEEDSGEGGLSAEDTQQRHDLEEKLRQLREAELMVRQLEEENKNKDDHSSDVASPDAEGKTGSRSLTRLHPTPRHSKRNSLELWRSQRDHLSSQLKSHSAHPQHRFMSNTRRHLGSGFGKISKGLKKLRRPKSANGEDDEDSSLRVKSASVEDIHQHSSVIDYDVEEEDEDMEGPREEISALQKRNKELEVTTLKHESAITGLQSELAALTKALEGEKEKADNLQVSFLEVMELKQHEVNNLQNQLSSVEKQTFDRHQFLEEQLDECNTKIDHLERALHQKWDLDPTRVPASSPLTRRFLMAVISSLLLVFTTVLAFSEYVIRGWRWVWQSVFRESRFLAVLSIVLAPIASYLLYLAVHSTTDYG